MDSPAAVISGGMGGIGQVTARWLAQDGYQVQLLYHHSPKPDVDDFLKSLTGDGHGAYQCDISDPASVNAAMRTLVSTAGRIDACIHTAVSPLVRKRAASITPEEFRAQFEVTTFGGLNLFHAVIPYFEKQRSGKIIGLTTAALETSTTPSRMAGYICAKYALRGLLRELALELGPLGIGVCAVAPGFVETPLHKDLPERAIELLKLSGMATVTSEEVAGVIASICKGSVATMNGLSYPVVPYGGSSGTSSPAAL